MEDRAGFKNLLYLPKSVLTELNVKGITNIYKIF